MMAMGDLVAMDSYGDDLPPPPDYDYDAARAAGVQPDERGHFPDTYKLPNHMTFSDQSIYNTGENKGGHWEQTPDQRWLFTPGPTNLQHHTPDELRDYFSQREPNATLVLPGMGGVAATDQYGSDPAAQGLEDFAKRIELLQRDPSVRWGQDGMNPEDRGHGVSIDQMPNYALDNPSRLQMYQHYYGPQGGIGTPNIPSQQPNPFRGRRT